MLAEVLRLLHDGYFSNKEWEKLGLELGLYDGTLATIKVNNYTNTDACLRDTLVKWLHKADGVDSLGRRPSWNALCDALDRIHFRTTADYIRKQTNTIKALKGGTLYNSFSLADMHYKTKGSVRNNKINRYICGVIGIILILLLLIPSIFGFCAIILILDNGINPSTWAVICSLLILLLLAIGLSLVYLKCNRTVINFVEPQVSLMDSDTTLDSADSADIIRKVPSPVFTELPSLNKRIWIYGELGEDIVDACISLLTESNLFLDDQLFMKRIAHVMSHYGKPPFLVHTDGGIWQVSIFAFNDTYDTRVHRRLSKKYEQIYRVFGINWNEINRNYLGIPMYSAIAARLYLGNFAEPIPPAYQIGEQADYWWNIYLMDHESKPFMRKSDFIESANTLCQY